MGILQDQDADVRQSAFALVGDLAKAHAPLLGPVASDIFRLGIAQLEPPAIQQQSMSACNNACWSLGKPSALRLAVTLYLYISPYSVPGIT